LPRSCPARLGLVSVGADGQLFVGAIFGTAIVLGFRTAPAVILLPAMLLAGMIGGALWGFVPGLLRGRLDANETIITAVAELRRRAAGQCSGIRPMEGPFQPGLAGDGELSGGGDAAGTVRHANPSRLLFGLMAATCFGILFARSRWGRELAILKGNAKVGRMIGLSFSREAMLVMSLGGALGGLAGICEVAAIQGRLQPGNFRWLRPDGISGGVAFGP